MAFTCGFFNSQNGDRKYNAEQISAIFDGLIKDGVYDTVGQMFAVTAGTGMQVLVGSGRAWFDHTWNNNDAQYPLAITAADVSLKRYDTVVLETNHSDTVRANRLRVVTGTPASNPSKPTLTNTTNVKQHALAHILIPAGTTAITASMITIVVGTSECPFVTGIIETASIDALFNQWNGEFDEWFENLKSVLSDNVVANLQKQIDALSNGKLDSNSKASGLDVINTTKDNVYMTPKSMEAMYPKGTIGLFTTESYATRPYLGTKWQRCNGSLISSYNVVAQQIDPLFYRLYHRFGPRLSGGNIYGNMDTVYNPSDGNFYWLYYDAGLKCRKLSSDSLGGEQTLITGFSSLDSSVIGVQYIGCAIHSTTGFCVAVAVNKGSSSKSRWYIWILTPSNPNNLLSSTWNHIELSSDLFYAYNQSPGSHSNVCVAGNYYFVPLAPNNSSNIVLVSKDLTNWGAISFSSYQIPDGVVVDQDGYATCVVRGSSYGDVTCYRLRWSTSQLDTIISNPGTSYSASNYLTETIGTMPTTYGGTYVYPRLRRAGAYYFLNWDNSIRVYSSLASMTSPTAIKTWSGYGICAYDIVYMHGYYIMVFYDCTSDGRQTGDRSRYAVWASISSGSFTGIAGWLMEDNNSTVLYNMYGCYMAKLPSALNLDTLPFTYLTMGKSSNPWLTFSLPIGHRVPYLPSPESGLEYLWFAGNWSGAS